ncbi:MAG: hypothetical protein AB8C13_04525 [Phycisphaerales bacterium]
MSDYKIPNPDYPTELIDKLKPLINYQLIQVVGSSDHGERDSEHEAAIYRILDEPRIPRPIQWEPKEVFALTKCWAAEEHEHYSIRKLSIKQAHRACAFSCACLLACADHANEQVAHCIPGLLTSVQAIDPSWIPDALKLINWASRAGYREDCQIEDLEHEDVIATLCAEIIGACMTKKSPNDLERIENWFERIQTVMLEEINSINQLANTWEQGHWIWKSTLLNTNNFDHWARLVRKYPLDPPNEWDDAIRDRVVRLGRLMTR